MTRIEKITEARRLRAEEGMSYAKIGRALGFSKHTARNYCLFSQDVPPHKPKKRTIAEPCAICKRITTKLHKMKNKLLCDSCLCPPFRQQKVEDFIRLPSGLGPAEDDSENDTFGRKSQLAKALNRAIKKHNIPKISPQAWNVGVEHY